MGWLATVTVLLLLLMLPGGLAADLPLAVEGRCREFTAFVPADRCGDVKVDVTTADGRVGQVYDPRGGWKSSVYFVQEVCPQAGQLEVRVRTETREPHLFFRASLREGEKMVTSDFVTVEQQCLRTEDVTTFLLPVLVVILLLVAGVVWAGKKR